MRLRLLGYYVHGSIAALAIVELLAFFFLMYLAVVLRFALHLDEVEAQIGPIWPRATVFAISGFFSFVALGLYTSRQRARSVGLAIRVVMGVLAATGATAIVFYMVPILEISRVAFAMTAIFATGASLLVRALFEHVVDADVFKRRVLVYGASSRATTLANLRRRADRRGHIIVGFLRAAGEEIAVPPARVLEPDGNLQSLSARLGIDEIVVAMEDRRREFPVADLLNCRLAGLEVTDIVTFFERETGRVRVDLMSPAWMIFGVGFRRDVIRRITSRVLDLAASALILVVCSPLIILTALAIKLEDGPSAEVFYKQPRVGYGGRVFNLLKFRSMRIDAERDGQAIWAQKNDPRVTRVGAFIRKLRIDELPQIINVLGGWMSFVGPRPERPQFVDELSAKIPYYAQRHSVKPGITGWAQLCYPYGSSEHDALQKLQYDLYYIKHNSFLLDIAILLQTAEVVFMGKGAR